MATQYWMGLNFDTIILEHTGIGSWSLNCRQYVHTVTSKCENTIQFDITYIYNLEENNILTVSFCIDVR
jgi:uncharacterized protein YcfJ